MSDLTPDRILEALDVASCQAHQDHPDAECWVCIIDEAARRYVDALGRPLQEEAS